MPSAPQSPMTGMMTQTGAEAQPQPTYLYDQTQLQFAQSKIFKIISKFRLIYFSLPIMKMQLIGFQNLIYNYLFLDEKILFKPKLENKSCMKSFT